MSASISPSVRGKSWIFPVTALCVLLGMLLAMALKTTRQAASEGIPTREPALRAEFRNIKEENEKLRKDIAYYKSREEELARLQAQGLRTTTGLQRQLDDAKTLSGLVSVRGPGVIVTLDDSPKLDPAETSAEIIERYIVHDTDILAVCNELTSAGAEAISVNDERLVATSSVRCVGALILVNSKRVARPYLIKAIGNPEDLEKVIEMPGGVADVNGLLLLDMIKVERKPIITVRAYEGSTRLEYAQPIVQRKARSESRAR